MVALVVAPADAYLKAGQAHEAIARLTRPVARRTGLVRDRMCTGVAKLGRRNAGEADKLLEHLTKCVRLAIRGCPTGPTDRSR